MQKNRYAGISPFTGEQKDIFFGREKDIEQLYEQILFEKQVVLYAKSGIGKSSLMNAGVVPKIEETNKFTPLTIRFRAYTEKNAVRPAQRVFDALEQLSGTSKVPDNSIIDKIVPQSQQTFRTAFKKLQMQNETQPILLVFDQFEELFTYPAPMLEEFKFLLSEILNGELPADLFDIFADARDEYPDLIDRQTMRQLNQPIDIKSVYIIRSDRLSQLNQLRDRIPDIQKSYYELQPLTTEQAKEAIVNPAQKDGDFDSPKFEYDPAALNKIIDYLTNGGEQNVETTQLQIVCQRIENGIPRRDRSRPVHNNEISDLDRSRPVPTVIRPNDIPDFKNIFFDFYNTAIETIAPNQQSNARRLVEDELIRNQQRISLDGNICTDYIPDTELQKLVNAHLLRAERNTVGGFSYELSHDTLIEPIHEAAEKRRAKEEEEQAEREKAEKEKEKKERIEREKKLKQQRLIISIVSVAAVVSLAFAVFGFIMMNRANETLEKLKSDNYLRHIDKGKMMIKTNPDYEKAIENFENARSFIETPEVDSLIAESQKRLSEYEQYNSFLQKADSLFVLGKYIEAMQKYQKAAQLKYDPETAKTTMTKRANEAIDELTRLAEKMKEYGDENAALILQQKADSVKQMLEF